MLQCCIKNIRLLVLKRMFSRQNSPLHLLRRRFNTRLLASCLLVLQLLSMALIAAHSIGHAHATRAYVAGDDSPQEPSATGDFARLFGHAAGADCDDWSAAFASDRDASSTSPAKVAPVSSGVEIALSPDASPHASTFTLFLARGPPNRLSTT